MFLTFNFYLFKFQFTRLFQVVKSIIICFCIEHLLYCILYCIVERNQHNDIAIEGLDVCNSYNRPVSIIPDNDTIVESNLEWKHFCCASIIRSDKLEPKVIQYTVKVFLQSRLTFLLILTKNFLFLALICPLTKKFWFMIKKYWDGPAIFKVSKM